MSNELQNQNNHYTIYFTTHAIERMNERNITKDIVYNVIKNGIADFSNEQNAIDYSLNGIHVLFNEKDHLVVTVYRNDSTKKKLKKRRQAKNRARRLIKHQQILEE